MNWIEQAFSTLNIKITKDERTIKKAYAKQVKQYHPEEYPEEWSRIHNAYEMALRYAKGENERIVQYWDDTIHQEKQYSKNENQKDVVEQHDKEISQENENSKENNEYNDIFQTIQESGQQKKKAIIEEAKSRLDYLVEAWDKATLDNWKVFLQSSLFATACEEEEFLLYLIYLLPKIKIEANVLKLLQTKMEELDTTFYVSMQLSKAKLVNEIEKICNNEAMRNSIGKMAAKSRTIQEKKQSFGTRFIMGFISIIVLFIIAVSIWVGLSNQFSDKEISIEMTEEQAKEEIISYLRLKYPDVNYTKDDIVITDFKGSLINDKAYKLLDDKILGYEGTINDNEPFDIIIMIGAENGTNEGKAICFDNRQENEIIKDLQFQITTLTGIENGTAYLSVDEDSFIASYINTVGYHSFYNGDLEAFFNEEANYRNDILICTNDGNTESMKYYNESNINGRCSVYFSNSEIISIAQRLESQTDNNAEKMQEVLQKLASTYQIQMVGAILPQDFYQVLMFNAENDSSVYEWVEKGGNFYSGFESISPLMSPFISSWYISESYSSMEDEYFGGVHVQNAVNLADGVYVLNKYVLAQQNLEQQSALNVGELQMVDMPEGMQKYLEEQNIVPQKTVNFNIKSFSEFEESYILVIDKAKLGIPESGYQVAITIPKTKYSDEEYKLLHVNSYGEKNTKAMLTTACEGEGYFFLDYNVMESDESPITVTIILD